VGEARGLHGFKPMHENTGGLKYMMKYMHLGSQVLVLVEHKSCMSFVPEELEGLRH
jgi:hypothetical protein